MLISNPLGGISSNPRNVDNEKLYSNVKALGDMPGFRKSCIQSHLTLESFPYIERLSLSPQNPKLPAWVNGTTDFLIDASQIAPTSPRQAF